MVSALVSLENSVVVFNVATNEVAEDPETGNIVPVTEQVTYRLFLRRGSSSSPGRMQGSKMEVRELPGADEEQAAYEGYCISPTTLDNRIRTGTTATLSFAGEPTHECIVEDCRFTYGSTGLLGQTLRDVLGHKVRLIASDYLGVDN